MNRIAQPVILAAALALLPLGVVRGQAPADTASAQTLDAQAAAKPPAAAKRRVRPHADARACLDFATNFEVIVCAEKYR